MNGMTGTPRSEMFDDVYFSAEGGAEETRHVFLDGNDLPARWQGRRRFTIGETGFGTGLNFLLAWELFERTAEQGAFLDFISVEKYPLSREKIRSGLSAYAARLSPYLEKMLAQYPEGIPGFHRMVFDNRVALTLIIGDANDVLPEVEGSVDAWFLDGFTPSKNPDMWTGKVFAEMARLSAAGASVATFTAAGFVKRGLRDAGFAVQKRKGFGSKRDMLAGNFTGGGRITVPAPSSVSILGAGLAGAACAHVFPRYGLNVSVTDPNGVAGGASGNPVGLINPRLSAFRTAESDFYAGAFAMAARVFPALGAGYEACGGLHLITDEDKEKRFARCVENWGWDAADMRVVSAAEASDIAGIRLDRPALYLPSAGRIDPSALCHAYLNETPVTADAEEADVTIYACGTGSLAAPALAGLPIHTVRGQITFVRATDVSMQLKANIHYGGYVSTTRDGMHAVGSTFQKWLTDTTCLDTDDAQNLQNLAVHVPSAGDFEIIGHRAALRTASKDRFPIVGRVEGGYVTTAHGSHGIVSTLLSAHILADAIRGGPFCVSRATLSALSPERFLKS